MARFYGQLHGQAKTATSRIGSRSSGLTANIRGWNIGVRVDCRAVDEADVIQVYVTTGSSGHGPDQHIATITQYGDKPRVLFHLKEDDEDLQKRIKMACDVLREKRD